MVVQDLASKNCVPCKGIPPMGRPEIEEALKTQPGWTLNGGMIEREFRFKSYLAGLGFAYAVGKLAEQQDHHPDMLVGWRRVRLTFTTHVIKGLSMNDFIMAAKAEVEYQKYGSQ